MKTALVAAALVSCLAITPALANDVVNAKALLEQGIELYRVKKYPEAIAALKRSYELDPKTDTLYALAQAERLGGRCPDAIVHYNKLLEQSTDLTLAAAVKNNLGLCTPSEPEPTAEPPKPTVVVKQSGRPVALPVTLIAVGALSAGASVGLFIAAGHSQDASRSAPTYDEYRMHTDRAGVERAFGYVFMGVGVASLGAGIYLIVRKPKSTEPTVTASYAGGTGAVWLQGRW